MTDNQQNEAFSQITKKVFDFYMASGDFNGITLANLYKYCGLNEEDFKTCIKKLILNNYIDLIYEGEIPNPHIKPFPAPASEKQIEKLLSIDIDKKIQESVDKSENYGSGEVKIVFSFDTIGCCVYPSKKLLQEKIDIKEYVSRPYEKELASGEWQLRPYYFELSILAIYRNDPRYRYRTDDIVGSIYSIMDEDLNENDRIFLKYFYFGFDEDGNRAVAVLLCDLWKINPAHQQIWQAKMLPDTRKFYLHPDARSMILGNFPEKVSIFTAFLKEIEIINTMSKEINGKDLFQLTFTDDDKPENFGFLILPTLREYELFCITLDKIMSENINEKFFESEVFESDVKNGKKLCEIKGITKLNIWILKKFLPSDPKPIEDMIKTFRDIRDLRSEPSHNHSKNVWDSIFYQKQNDLVNRAYSAISLLRLILTNHPKARHVKVPEWLYKGEIRNF